jgi:hypothetical protein
VETRVTIQNYIHEEVRRELSSGNPSRHSDHKFLSSRLLSKSVNIEIHTELYFYLFPCTGVKLGLSPPQWQNAD